MLGIDQSVNKIKENKKAEINVSQSVLQAAIALDGECLSEQRPPVLELRSQQSDVVVLRLSRNRNFGS